MRKSTLIRSTIFFVLLSVLSAVQVLHAQVTGCTDPLANNFNASATINNGSCTYNVTAYTPPLKVAAISDSLMESSGLQMAGNFLWSFNDGGGQAAIYRIDTTSNTILQKVILQNATNIDWEDIAFDGVSFFIGDFGNNFNGARTNLRIYKFPLSAIPGHSTSAVATIPEALIETINFSYSDQAQPPVATTANHTKFDCEAMIVDDGKIHLFTKNWIDLTTTHYEINSVVAGTYIATPLETLSTNYLVTAADKAPGQKIVALLGYKNSGFADHFIHLLSGYSDGKYFNGNKRQINFPNVFEMGQAEGITFRTAGYGYISNERFAQLNIPQRLRSFNIGNFVSTINTTYTFSGNGNWDLAANWTNSIPPPASMVSGSEIIIDPQAGGSCILNIPYNLPAGVKLTVNNDKVFIIQGNLTIQ